MSRLAELLTTAHNQWLSRGARREARGAAWGAARRVGGQGRAARRWVGLGACEQEVACEKLVSACERL